MCLSAVPGQCCLAQGPRLAKADNHREAGSHIGSIGCENSQGSHIDSDPSHLTSGVRRKTESPPSIRQPPALPDHIARRPLDTSSDEPGEESVAENEPKRLRSTSNTPQSDSG